MKEIIESVSELNHIFQQKEIQDKGKMEKGLKILRFAKENRTMDDFMTLFSCFVNLYLIDGLHLTLQKNATTNKKEDERSFVSATRNDHQFFHYTDNEAELSENRAYFLAEVEKISTCVEEFAEIKNLFLGIYHQEKDHFLSLLEKNYPIVDYYLFYMAIRDHIFAIEQRKNGTLSKEAFSATKEELCIRYRFYQKRDFTFPQIERNDGSVATETMQSRNIPQLPLPILRYSDSLCQDMLENHTNLVKLPRFRGDLWELQSQVLAIDEKLRDITEKQQLGNITEKGSKNHQDLYSNIPEIRMEYLMFPLKMDFDRNTFSLLMQNYLDYQVLKEKNRDLDEKNKLLENYQKEKDELLKEHAHNWTHMQLPSALKDISAHVKELLDQPLAMTLDKIYADFLLHKSDLELLKLKYESTSDRAFLKKFRYHLSSTSQDTNGAVKTLEHIIAVSLELVLYRVLFQESKNGTYSLSTVSTNQELKEKYIQFDRDKQSELDIFQWFSQEIYPFQVSIPSKDWYLYGFLKNEVAYFYMEQLMIDLLNNALNYGVKSREGSIHIVLDSAQERINEKKKTFMSIRIENPVDLSTAFMFSSRQGIKSIKNSIGRLNCAKNLDEFTLIDKTEDLFSVQMKIQRKHLQYEPLDE